MPSIITLYITRKWMKEMDKRLHSLAQIVLKHEQQIACNLKMLLLHDDMQIEHENWIGKQVWTTKATGVKM